MHELYMNASHNNNNNVYLNIEIDLVIIFLLADIN